MNDDKILCVVDAGAFVKRQNAGHSEPKWWACPTKLSLKAERLISSPNGVAHYGVWCLLVSYMARRKFRWTLTDSDGKPTPLRDLAWLWRVDESVVTEAVDALVLLGWLSWRGSGDLSPDRAPDRHHGHHKTDKTDSTNKTNTTGEGVRNLDGDGRWTTLAGRLRIGIDGITAIRQAMELGVPVDRFHSALRDKLDSRTPVESPNGWAITVSKNLIEECCS